MENCCFLLFYHSQGNIVFVCVYRWEEEYAARMDLQERVAELEEVCDGFTNGLKTDQLIVSNRLDYRNRKSKCLFLH